MRRMLLKNRPGGRRVEWSFWDVDDGSCFVARAVEMQRLTRMEVICTEVQVVGTSWCRWGMWKLRVRDAVRSSKNS